MLHGLRHLLTPGTPVYAVLKIAAIAAVIALQVAARRRARSEPAPAPGSTQPAARKAPHPRSKKRGSRRRRSG